MQLSIQGKNLEVTESIERHIQHKIGKLGHYLPSIDEAKVELTLHKTKSAKDRLVVQVTLNHNGTLLRGEERAADAFSAIDAVTDVMQRQLERYKGKLYKSNLIKRALNRKTAQTSIPATSPEETHPKIARVKRFPIKPMSVEEAVEQMELLGHDFFLFLNSTSSDYNVIYRRRDGNYGLIEPELL